MPTTWIGPIASFSLGADGDRVPPMNIYFDSDQFEFTLDNGGPYPQLAIQVKGTGVVGTWPTQNIPHPPIAAGETKDVVVASTLGDAFVINEVDFLPLSAVASSGSVYITASLYLVDLGTGTLGSAIATLNSQSGWSARVSAGEFALSYPYTIPAGHAIIGRLVSTSTGALTAGGTWTVGSAP